MLNGTTWQAESRAPYWPHAETEVHGQLIVRVGNLLILHTHTVPVGTDRDLFTLTVNGRPVVYSRHLGELPHLPATIATAVARHVRGTSFGECDQGWCGQPPTVATYIETLCATHAGPLTTNTCKIAV